MNVQTEVLEKLDELNIPYRILEHSPVENMADCLPNAQKLGAVMPKNLFLTPRSEKAYFLAIVPADSVFKTSDISKQLDSARLSFASAEKLAEFLRTVPGAISPLGLLFDTEKRVQLAMDRSLAAEPVLAFHPCVPTSTVALENADFFHFLRLLNIEIHWINTEKTI